MKSIGAMRKFLYSISSILIIALSISLLGEDVDNVNKEQDNLTYNLTNTKLPDAIEFCGEVFTFDDPEIKERAERELLLLLQQPGQILLYIKRSGKYFDMYDSYIERFNLPKDLKYVSVAESALYMSRSRAGAMGLWQFMPGTARSFDLRVDKYVDERRHPEKSTVAALQYLSSAKQQFGTWLLAIASYNRGKYGIEDDLEFQGQDNYFDLYLNEETSRYVFRILIIKEMMTNPERYGFSSDNIEKYKLPEYREVKVSGGIENLSDWAKSEGTTYKMVKLLNPWILKRYLNSPGRNQHYYIKVPK